MAREQTLWRLSEDEDGFGVAVATKNGETALFPPLLSISVEVDVANESVDVLTLSNYGAIGSEWDFDVACEDEWLDKPRVFHVTKPAGAPAREFAAYEKETGCRLAAWGLKYSYDWERRRDELLPIASFRISPPDGWRHDNLQPAPFTKPGHCAFVISGPGTTLEQGEER